MKTEDGGETWNFLPIEENYSIQMIDFINESDGWAIGWAYDVEKVIILKSQDGGLTWLIQKEL